MAVEKERNAPSLDSCPPSLFSNQEMETTETLDKGSVTLQLHNMKVLQCQMFINEGLCD